LDESLRHQIAEGIQANHVVRLVQDSPSGLVLEVDDQAVSFSTYGYPLLDPTDTVSNVPLAGLTDIGLMKLDAIAGQGMRKDFADLYFLCQHVPLDVLFARSVDKYPHDRGSGMRVLSALVDFEIADQQEPLTLLLPAEWHEIKAFHAQEARRLGQMWFGLEQS
jgi:hypothetical protein